MRKEFERSFLKLAAVAFQAQFAAMGVEIIGGPRGNLAFHCLGIVDYCGEMRLLCAETRRAL